jgi:predicted amidohydrolase YtcJ
MNSIYASVSRQLTDGIKFFPEQCMTREEALRSYTIDCAHAAFEETSKGSLVPGKLADIVVFSNNLLTCPDEEIKNTKALTTIVAGKVVFQKNETEKEVAE